MQDKVDETKEELGEGVSPPNIDIESQISDNEDRLLATVSSRDVKAMHRKSSTPRTRDNSPSLSNRDGTEIEKDIPEVCWKRCWMDFIVIVHSTFLLCLIES